MGERVLITGGAGFVGLHLARRLLAEGAEVTLLDDFSRGRRDRDLDAVVADVRLIEHDLTVPLPDALLPGRYDSVYHLAAVVGVRRVSEGPGRVMETNLRAAQNVLDWCRRHGPDAVFVSSTSEVGDGAAETGLAALPVPESAPFVLADPSRPRSSYALSKMATEALFRHGLPGSRVRIGRYHNIYGPRMGHEHVIPEFIDRALRRCDPFPVYGRQFRAFCHIDDAVTASIDLTRLPGPEPVVANIGNDSTETATDDLARLVLRLAGHPADVQIFDPPAGSPARRRPDLAVLRSLTGYQPSVDLAAGLRDTFDWYATREAA